MSNIATDILSAWTALEVLSPQSFKYPKDLASGRSQQHVASLKKAVLPWEGQGEKARPKTRLYYQVVLGTIHLEPAVTLLSNRYVDKRVERPTVRGESILAVVVVNRDGCLLESPASAISSFAWGLQQALTNDLKSLANWPLVEQGLIDGLDNQLRESEGNEKPLNSVTIQNAYEWLINTLGIDSNLTKNPYFAIRHYQPFSNSDEPTPIVINSFFLSDLGEARNLFSSKQATKNLRLYLGEDVPGSRSNILENNSVLESSISPEKLPFARWPGKGRYPLVMLQQAVVNLAFSDLKDSGILAVNGPPGTGKTTLLRDIVAALVTDRAKVMSTYTDPEKAFKHSGEKLKTGAAWLHFYELEEKIKGFEMLIASSNNKAVENVSSELPKLDAIASDADNLRYFSIISDYLLDNEQPKPKPRQQTWGLIAGVLGNLSNRSQFRQKFWWDRDFGLSTYLAAASGIPQVITIKDKKTGKIIEEREPFIVLDENPPKNRNEALDRWKKARENFIKIVEKSKKSLNALSQIREKVMKFSDLIKREEEMLLLFEKAKTCENELQERYNAFMLSHAKTSEAVDQKINEMALHKKKKPSFFACLFNLQSARAWKAFLIDLLDSKKMAVNKLNSIKKDLINAECIWEKAKDNSGQIEKKYLASKTLREDVSIELDSTYSKLSKHIIDKEFFKKSNKEKHTTSPWCDDAMQHIRDDVFIAAIKLHKAFIDAAAKPLRHNLGVLMLTFSGRSMPNERKAALLSDIWASLFLVVPCVSTTFASVGRMLGNLPPESLGWLLVDEAGQALPQAVVGALMRTKRAIVVGDPMQIEPIVALPDTLTQAICRKFNVDPDKFNAPEASCQTLADASTSYYTEFECKQGSREVGVPLLVHRRCREPMFSISNIIAYERLMVNAKSPTDSNIRECLGESKWIDVKGGEIIEKWSDMEGKMVLELLKKLKMSNVNPDLYIITPFTVVAENLRIMIHDSQILMDWISGDSFKWCLHHIGTVHTVQGKEAQAIIFVLGAPMPQQRGARGWAGKTPNLLNVAVTRAKEVIYVVGNRELWRDAGLFSELYAQISEVGG